MRVCVCAQVTTDLDAEPFYGDWLKVVKEPLGWIALGTQLAAILLQYLFGKWAQHATALRKAQVRPSCRRLRVHSTRSKGRRFGRGGPLLLDAGARLHAFACSRARLAEVTSRSLA